MNQNPSTARSNPNPDRQSNNINNAPPKTGVTQPTPQTLPKRATPSSILVSPRQKGNPVLSAIKSLPWEYADIPADYVLGATTCALFLSLKYHRLHPEYIYTRIQQLRGKYDLRLVLCMVDIGNHEESLKELSKTSLINNVTLILCWSSAEGARYLELFKTYENAAPTAIRQRQSERYGDRMVEFVTMPRSVNKTDAVSLVSQFGRVRTAVNAREEEVGGVAGWGEKKCKRWCGAVREPFRLRKAAGRAGGREGGFVGSQVGGMVGRDVTGDGDGDEGATVDPVMNGALQQTTTTPASSKPGTAAYADRRPSTKSAEEMPMYAEAEAARAQTMTALPIPPAQISQPATEVRKKRKPEDDPLSDGVMAALSKLRKS